MYSARVVMSDIHPQSGEHCQDILPRIGKRLLDEQDVTLPDVGNNLKRLRNAKGWTQQEAADAMGLGKSGYIKLERSERELTSRWIGKAARAYAVSDAAVIETPRTCKVVGYVGAGSAAHYYDVAHAPDDEVTMPANGNDSTVAVEVRGDSLGSLLNGWLVYYDDVRHPPTDDLYRQLCVVGLADGRVLVKKLVPGSSRGHYHLVSQTEGMIENAAVSWAALVTAILRRH